MIYFEVRSGREVDRGDILSAEEILYRMNYAFINNGYVLV